jgi:hypothetical protein
VNIKALKIVQKTHCNFKIFDCDFKKQTVIFLSLDAKTRLQVVNSKNHNVILGIRDVLILQIGKKRRPIGRLYNNIIVN